MIEEVLKERGARYGAFKDHAQICQDLKKVMTKTPSWNKLSAPQAQALEVIADKIARMLNGDPNYDDNWIDIIGYSQLVLDDMKEHDGQTKMEFEEVLITEPIRGTKEYIDYWDAQVDAGLKVYVHILYSTNETVNSRLHTKDDYSTVAGWGVFGSYKDKLCSLNELVTNEESDWLRKQ